MALIVEDGTGKSDADSYSSIAELDAYNLAYGNDARWRDKTLQQKEEFARLATQGLDLEYSSKILGTIKESDQALLFPRVGIEDPIDGFVYDDDSVPTRWKYAHAELSLELARGTLLHAAQSDSSGIIRERKKLGPIEIEKTYSASKASSVAVADFPRVDRLVSRFTTGDSGVIFRG
jgi:hypothetical protein